MRGGALPVLAWCVLMAVLMAGNWVWTGDEIQVAEFGFVVLILLFTIALLRARSRTALRRGAPAGERMTTPAPTLSFGAVLCAVAIAAVLFGLTFGHFVIYFGCGLLVIGLGRVAVELRSARASARQLSSARASIARRTGS